MSPEMKKYLALKQSIGNSKRKIAWYKSIEGANRVKKIMTVLGKGKHNHHSNERGIAKKFKEVTDPVSRE